jgi:hypothetical protein
MLFPCGNRKIIMPRHTHNIPAGERPALRKALAVRDDTWCSWCGLDIDMDAIGGPWGPSVDHWIALADGGSNDLGNLCLMHAYCNSKKSSVKHLIGARAAKVTAKAERAVRHEKLMTAQRLAKADRKAAKLTKDDPA